MTTPPQTDVLGQLATLAMLRDQYDITLDYETILERDYRRFLGPGHVVVDVGAHQGRHTSVFASLVGEKGKVLAFEAAPAMFGILSRLGLGAQVQLHNVALSDRSGESEFFFAEGTPGESGLRQIAYTDPGLARPTRIQVRLAKLDGYTADLRRLDYIKIDVEGAEIECIKGAAETIVRLRPVVSVEYGFRGYSTYGHKKETLFELAQQLGYAVADLFGNVIDSLELWQRACDNVYWDYFLVPAERATAWVELIRKAGAAA